MANIIHVRRSNYYEDHPKGITEVHHEEITAHISTPNDHDPEQDEDLPPSPWDERFGPPPSEN